MLQEMRREALGDLVGLLVVGPSGAFPISPATARALFGLAVDRLARYDKTTANLLGLFAAQFARMEELDRTVECLDLTPAAAEAAWLRWLVSTLTKPSIDLSEDFERFSRVRGKQTCHPRTLRRQDARLRDYAGAHNYPTRARDLYIQRRLWVREHLQTMITEAQTVQCLHLYSALTKEDLDKVSAAVGKHTSVAKLSAMVLAQLHSTTPGYLLKRLLPRRRQK